ncbi:MAG: ATP-dependent Clp protease ATP-binding subunit, partial [Clostridia bacterium]|nr:ATP-dependent Clp protease ATP-binding subunit [Clostridia bacterium]
MKQVLCSKCKKNPAVVFISKVNDNKSEPEGYCIKCAMEMNIGPVKHFMDNMGISEDDMDAITEQVNQMLGFDSDDDFEEGGAPTMPSLQSLFGALGNPDMAAGLTDPDAMGDLPAPAATEEADAPKRGRRGRKGEKGRNKKRRFLGLYCTDLTARARNNELDNIVGRDQEINRAIQILCRRSKNNPCLIGEPGVGKTAIAEGLAERIAKGEVPAKLADKEIHLLDLTALVAGTQFRGQFESRIKGLIDEVKAEGNIILFIDEIHNLVGTGDAEGN